MKNKMKINHVILLFVVLSLKLNSQSNWNKKPFERKVFIENKGQFNDKLSDEFKDFDYCIDNGTRILFNNNKLVYWFTKSKVKEFAEEERNKSKREKERESEEEEREKFKPETQFISVEWINSNPNATIEVLDKSSVDFGYIVKTGTGLQDYKTQHCSGYNKLIIKNLYNGIDAEYFFTEKDGFKYNLIVHPNADITQISFKYNGTKKPTIQNDEIHLKTILGDLVEHQPVTFTGDKNTHEIPSSYKLSNDVISFDLANRSKTSLVIDPWVTVPGLGGTDPVDSGVDQFGNSYVSNGTYTLENILQQVLYYFLQAFLQVFYGATCLQMQVVLVFLIQ